jgi:hypothetical protein
MAARSLANVDFDSYPFDIKTSRGKSSIVEPVLRTDVTHERPFRGGAGFPTLELQVNKMYWHRGPWNRNSVSDLELATAANEAGHSELSLVIDRRVAWARVVAALQIVQNAGFNQVRFIFRKPDVALSTGHSKFDDDFKVASQKEQDGETMAMIDFYDSMLKPCGALVELFESLGWTEFANANGETNYILRHLAPALTACNCATSPVDMKKMLWQRRGNHRPVGMITVALDASTKPLAATADASWEDVSKGILIDEKKFWFVVR